MVEGIAFQNWVFILIMLQTTHSEHIDCRQRADLRYNGTAIDCSHTGILRVPDKLPVNTTTLDLTFNNITILYNNNFLHLVNLRYLDVSFNPIHTLQSSSFNGLSSLLILEFNGHVLDYSETSMPVNVFKPLQSLTNLSMRSDVSRFPLRQFDLPDRVFGSLTNLRHLNIDTGSKTVFKSGFSNLTELRYLVIGDTLVHGTSFACGLGTLTNETLKGLLKTQITYLQLNSCNLQIFHRDSLQYLTNLTDFIMQSTSLMKGGLQDVFQALSVYRDKTMSTVSITNFESDSNDIGTASSISVKTVYRICVSHIDLSSSSIIYIDFEGVPPFNCPLMKCMKSIKLRHNKITLGSLHKIWFLFVRLFSNLETIDISLQRKFSVDDPTSVHRPGHTHLPIGIPVLLPPKIKSINVAGISAHTGPLFDIYFLNGNKLQSINVSYSGFSDFNHTIIGLKNLEILDFSHNDMSTTSETFFDTFPKLKQLRLNCVQFDSNFLSQHGKRLFSPLKNLESLDLSDNGLVFLPYDIFSSFVTLEVVNLAFNNLITIPDLTSLDKLDFIDLSHNSFTTLENKYRLMFDITAENNNEFHLSLWGNTFSCICESTGFLIWLQETSVKLDGGNYSCMDFTGKMSYTKVLQTQWKAFQRHCVSGFWLNMAMGGASVVVVTLITTFVFIKNKMKLKLILLRMIGQNIYPKKRNEFLYDAYIIYTDSIYSWVCNELRTELETNRKIKLNIRDRDHLPGGSHADDILEAVRDSWKIILILTEDFLKSDLAYFTMCNCLSAMTLTTPQRLIIVIDHQMTIPTNIDFVLEAVSQRNIITADIETANTCFNYSRLADIIVYEETAQ
ncbi:toll-like receptor 4 [Patella vulgata]|uniref:toll-like receptor 4 n=1 Tax=Patella vulgata TaxID=6465 RepID=UPI00218063BC|nr:toll-like receptor 4 [Patella vulgata]XP_050408762.1 toll-like receptor 4 [Patella vulgata]XP_050408772.1 toll-like receptor 4 [Patella vulgata]